jgi:hypothetical protein
MLPWHSRAVFPADRYGTPDDAVYPMKKKKKKEKKTKKTKDEED